MSTLNRFPLLAAGSLGLTGVALGAFGAHGLRDLLTERGMAASWETAARYQLVHSVALLVVAVWLRGARNGVARMLWAARCWSAGIVLFSGSLYLFAVGGPHALVFVTPLGGVALLLGWFFVIAAAFASDE